MANEVSIYACGTDVDAEAARQFLLARGYTDAQIIVNEQVATNIYNATQFNGGSKNETVYGKFIVIGKK